MQAYVRVFDYVNSVKLRSCSFLVSFFYFSSFFYILWHVSTPTRDIDIAILSVRPSVRHTPVFYIERLNTLYSSLFAENGSNYTVIYCDDFFTRQPSHSSFASIKHLLREISTGSSPIARGVKYRWDIKKNRHYSFSVPNGMAIFGRRMQGCMKKSRFSTNLSIYVGNDLRQGHSYYGRRIGNRTQAFEWYHFE